MGCGAEGQDGSALSIPARQGRAGAPVRGEEGHCGKYWGEEQTERRAERSQLASGPLRRPPPWAGHPPLGAQAAAEEEEGHPQDLQRPPAGRLERLPAEGGEPASELPSPRGQGTCPQPWPQHRVESRGCRADPLARLALCASPGYSHEPVQSPQHQLLPGPQGPCQPQGLVAGTQHTLKTQVGRVRLSTLYPCVNPAPCPLGPPLTLAVL